MLTLSKDAFDLLIERAKDFPVETQDLQVGAASLEFYMAELRRHGVSISETLAIAVLTMADGRVAVFDADSRTSDDNPDYWLSYLGENTDSLAGDDWAVLGIHAMADWQAMGGSCHPGILL